MCEKAASDGITHIVATPHCNHRYPFDRAASQAKVDELASRFAEISFSLGCELTITEKSFEEAVQNPNHFTIAQGRYMLVEPSEAYLPKQTEDVLSEFISMGIVPILAHPERNPLLRRRIDLLKEWVEMGCLSAVTGNSLGGFWGVEIKKVSETMLKQNLVHFLVSDAHDPERRVPLLAAALHAASKLIGKQAAHELVWENPAAVLAG